LSRAQIIALVVIVPAVLVGAWLIGSAQRNGDDGPAAVEIGSVAADAEFDYDFLIPPGTASAIASGEQVEIVPAELVVEVGDSIRITNNDYEDHIVGVFFVAAGETLTQQFNSPGVLEGECSVHPSGEFSLRVIE
jgi:plastocyanin